MQKSRAAIHKTKRVQKHFPSARAATVSHNLKESSLSLQIIHVRNNHWIALEISGSTVSVYDSSYTSLSADTQNTIAQLIYCKEKEITTNIMNISKQTGSNDRALFAMAVITHLAIGEDPTSYI